MTTATMAAPTMSVSDAYANLAAELHLLADRVRTGTLPPIPSAAPERRRRERPATVTLPRWVRRLVAMALDLTITFVVLPIAAFHVAMRLFPPVR